MPRTYDPVPSRTVAFLGLGVMGYPMAGHLAAAGHKVTVYNRTAAKSAEWVKTHGGASAATPAAAASGAEIVFACVGNDDDLRSITVGADGAFAGMKRGAIIVDHTTASAAVARELAEAAAARGIGFVDAPVSGGNLGATNGTLTVMCGGEDATVDRVRPYLRAIGNKILHMGPIGSGQLAKLVNQLLFDINAAALGEILPMAAKMGLDPDLVGEVVNSGTGRSYASEFFIPRILRGHFTDGYPMAHAYKDLVSGAELGANQGIPMPVLATATATYQTALLRGHGEKDKGAMVLVFEELLGVQVSSRTRS